MKCIRLDGNKMTSKKNVHLYLKYLLPLTGYYGNNLDALWDALVSTNESLDIQLTHSEKVIQSLGSYGVALIHLFHDAAKENRFITFSISDNEKS